MQSVAVDQDELLASLCRESFADFVKDFWEEVPGAGILKWNWHMDVLCSELQAAAERVFKGLPCQYDAIFNIPFGTSKSSVCSILFHPWTWTRMPESRHMTATHTESLGLDLSNKSRAVIRSEKYARLFPEIQLRDDQDAKSNFMNTKGGCRQVFTVGGKNPMGFHFHFIGIDDPIDPQKAISAVELENSRKFCTVSAPSRKVDKSITFSFLVMQRLHRDDPTGALMKLGKDPESGVKMRHICLPGELTPDVNPPELANRYIDGLLDPVRFPRSELKRYRSILGAYSYAGQVLQSPVSMGGGMFKEPYFNQRVKAAPFDCTRVLYIDRASTQDGGCYTAMVLLGRDKENNWYVEHVVHGQWEPTERNARIKAEALRCRNRYGPKHEPSIYVEAEGGSSGRDAWKALVKDLVGFKVYEDKVTGRKDVRAEPWSTQLSAGNVYIVDDSSWDVAGYVQEHCAFAPEGVGKRLGAYKDQVDASCLLGGTKVTTKWGDVRIEDVIAGDLVLTRKGWKRVIWSGCSGQTWKYASVFFSNGQVVDATCEHLVLTLERGFIRIDQLEGNDLVFGLEGVPCGGKLCQERRLFGSMESPITAGPEKGTFGILGVGEPNRFIGPSGNSTKDVFPLAIKFITKTETPATTQLKILNASLLQNMEKSTPTCKGLQGNSHIWTRFNDWQRSGTEAKKVGSGIPSMRRSRTENGSPGLSSVSFANENSCPKYSEGRGDSVQEFVTNGIERKKADVWSKSNARCAESNFSVPSESKLVPENAGREEGGGIPVYDLQVEGCHEFFANGILVHNSGAFNVMLQKKRPEGQFRIIGGGHRTQKGLRSILVSEEELSKLELDEPSVMIAIKDNPEEIPPHSIRKLLGWVGLQFADIQPSEHQADWNAVLEDGKTCSELMMQREQAKRIWSLLLKKHSPGVENIVIVDEGEGDRRGESVAMAVMDILGRPRGMIWTPRDPERKHDGEPMNEHVFAITKLGRGMVCG